jgi:uncharacterized protein DUF4179
MSNPKSVTLDVAIEQVLRGEAVTNADGNDGELYAARSVVGAVPDLLPTAATRERALRAVRERIAARSRPRSWWHLGPLRMPAPRLHAVPVAAVLLIGVLVGGAYAIPALLPQIFGMIDPSAVEVLQSGRAQELHLTQTVSGVTISADRAYADAQRIVVQFTVQNPPDDPGQPSNFGQRIRGPMTTGGTVTLTDSAGHIYRHIRGVENPLISISATRWNGEPLVGVYSFDASQTPADDERVSFQLTIAELRGVAGSAGVTHLPGPWTFTFVVPVAH